MERFLLGLPDMDEQHRYLYELFDRLEPAPAVTGDSNGTPVRG